MREKILLKNVEITDAVAEGKALARHENMVVFVSNAVPGDIADLMVYKKKKNFMEARAVHFHKLSEKRTEPVCSHFGMCGGCKWQHLKYSEQLFYKQKQIESHFSRIGNTAEMNIQPITGSEKTSFYRNKLEFTFSDHRWLSNEDIKSEKENIQLNGLGFHLPQHFDRVLDIENCHLQSVFSDNIRNSVKEYCISHNYSFYNPRKHSGFMRNLIIRNTNLDQWMVIVVFAFQDKDKQDKLLNHIITAFPKIHSLVYVINTKKNDTITDQEVHTFYGLPYITELFGNIRYRIGPVSFFQTNSTQAIRLYNKVKEFAQITNQNVVYDLYTGTGSIACYIAADAKKVCGIEYIPSAIEDAIVNSNINRIQNTEFICGDIAKTLNEDFFRQHSFPDIIITDPPRSGMHPEVIKQMLAARPEKIVYISCNPATQARDIELMKEDYFISIMQPFDMFPHTHHIENIALLIRKNKGVSP